MEALRTIKQFFLVTLIETTTFSKVRIDLKPTIYVLTILLNYCNKRYYHFIINFRVQLNYFLDAQSNMRLLAIFSFLSITIGVTIILSIIGESNGKRIIYCS